MESIRYAAAWVPDDDRERPWDKAAALAEEWIDDRAEELDADPVLVTNARIDPPFTGFVWGRDWFSRLSGGTARHQPVISYVPDVEDFNYALDIARDAAIVVVESSRVPVGGWAAEVEALNLLTGEPTPPNTAAVQALLKRLAFGGNNGYGDEYGKKMALAVIRELIATGEIEPALIPGALAAHGVSARGRKKIAAMIEQAQPAPSWSASRDW